MIELKRLPNWRSRFSDEMDRIRRVPFKWGHDCAIALAGNAVLAITGTDVVAKYRDKYDTLEGGMRILKREGFLTLADAAASFLPEYDHISEARVGDVVGIPTKSAFGFALGVVNGERAFVLMPDGIGTVDLLDATRAFKVG